MMIFFWFVTCGEELEGGRKMKGYISRSEQRIFACFGRARYCLDCSHLFRCMSWISLLTSSRLGKTKDRTCLRWFEFLLISLFMLENLGRKDFTFVGVDNETSPACDCCPVLSQNCVEL